MLRICAMSRYRMEMGWAINTQIRSLRKILQEDIEIEKLPMVIRTTISSAPFDESLFDSLTLFIKIDEDGTSHLRGNITEFHLPNDNVYHYEIKSFPKLEELKEWILTTKGVDVFCTEILCGKANL